MGRKRNQNKNEDQRAASPAAFPPPPPPAPPTTATSAMECDICNETFNDRGRKPRNLNCGHTFCSLCFSVLIKNGIIICPTCRRKTGPIQYILELPVNFPLLSMVMESDRGATGAAGKDRGFWDTGKLFGRQKKEEKSPHGGKCLEAGAEVAMHCAYCNLWLCKDCSRIDHSRQQCILVPYQETLREMGQAGKVKAMATRHALEEFLHEARGYERKLNSCAAILQISLDCVKNEQNNLPGVVSHCTKLERDLSDVAAKRIPSDLEEALCFLDSLEKVSQATQQWATDASSEVLKVDQVFRLSKALLLTSVHMHTTTSGNIMGLHKINGIDVILPIEMDGSRLLVHAADHMHDINTGSRLIKLELIKACIDPSRALTFLDIHLRGKEIGRVFIRLLGSTKRSRAFLMMCTGETGPSYRNTPFHRIWWLGKPGEHLWAGDYNHGDGTGGNLTKEIEDPIKQLSNEKTKVPVDAGLVAARFGINDSTIFRIYTRPSNDVVEEFALGRVEYGLQVFKDALKTLDDVTDLEIYGCGVVVEP